MLVILDNNSHNLSVFICFKPENLKTKHNEQPSTETSRRLVLQQGFGRWNDEATIPERRLPSWQDL